MLRQSPCNKTLSPKKKDKSLLLFCFVLFDLEARSHVLQADLRLTVFLKIALNF